MRILQRKNVQAASRKCRRMKWQALLCHLVHRKWRYGKNAGKLIETDENLHHNRWRTFQTFTEKKECVPK